MKVCVYIYRERETLYLWGMITGTVWRSEELTRLKNRGFNAVIGPVSVHVPESRQQTIRKDEKVGNHCGLPDHPAGDESSTTYRIQSRGAGLQGYSAHVWAMPGTMCTTDRRHI